MESFEHSFPLPETEAHKLDEVKGVLDHAPEGGRSGLPAFIHAQPWLAVGLAGLGGLLLGLWWSARPHSRVPELKSGGSLL